MENVETLKHLIAEQLAQSTDIELLDLVYTLLLSSYPSAASIGDRKR